jgi:hypothetical protein
VISDQAQHLRAFSSNLRPVPAYNSISPAVNNAGIYHQRRYTTIIGNHPSQPQSRPTVPPHFSAPTKMGNIVLPRVNQNHQLTPRLEDSFDDFSASAMFGGEDLSGDIGQFMTDSTAGANLDLNASLTVSPALLQTSFSSDQGSGHFTSESPFTPFDTYEMSPAGQDLGAAGHYYPLFDDVATASTSMVRNLSEQSISSESGNSLGHAKRPSLSQVYSSTSSAGISKPRQRKQQKDLKPIIVEALDGPEKKRAKNTLAARISRQKKLERCNYQDETIELLKEELVRRGYTGPLLER